MKYIHEITDVDNLAMASSADIGVEEMEYQRLGKSLRKEVSNLRNILLGMKNMPEYRNQVTVIDNFLIEFNKFLAYPEHEISY